MRLVAPHCVESIAVDIEDVAANLAGVPRCRFIRGDSVDVLRTIDPESCDLVFLDSSHQYQKTLDEVVGINRILAPNGVVCLHDTYPPNAEYATPGRCVDVWKAVAQLPWEHVTLAAEYGVTICRKSLGRQLLWREP
jgi:predicted O-methyltransferase YrrM